MFLQQQSETQLKNYINLLQRMGALSGLFSDNNVPSLYYRAAENIFCNSFEAENHSRSDTSADASKNNIGIGLKTFRDENGKTFQKIAEFNKKSEEYSNLKEDPRQFAHTVSELRNIRIDLAKKTHGLNELIYHCVTRKTNKFLIYEEPMNYIELDSIKVTKATKNSIHFTDEKSEYNFNLTKSTLFKRFYTVNPIEFDVEIIDNPFEFLENLNLVVPKIHLDLGTTVSVVLPLYSYKGDDKEVPEKSGLNQWNAGGRKRNPREIYIPVPAWIHKIFPDFFPKRDVSFNLVLPDGKKLSAKICQDGGKALMSNPNVALGEWLLGQVLNKKEKELLTYDDLEKVGIDSVEITKRLDGSFDIDFKKQGTFEMFADNNKGT